MVTKPQLKIYAEQWGIFWRFTPVNFRCLLTEAINSGSYNLDEFGNQLKGIPKSVKRYSNERVGYTSYDPNTYLFHMTDTDKDDWREIRRQIIKLDQRNEERIKKLRKKNKILRRENQW